MLGVAAWDVLTAAGGSLALTLIVTMIVGIGALAVLFGLVGAMRIRRRS